MGRSKIESGSSVIGFSPRCKYSKFFSSLIELRRACSFVLVRTSAVNLSCNGLLVKILGSSPSFCKPFKVERCFYFLSLLIKSKILSLASFLAGLSLDQAINVNVSFEFPV
jgi:hypothetical protein